MRLISAAIFSIVAAGGAVAQTPPTLPKGDPYYAAAQAALAARAAIKPIKKRAKNVILFVGDGMDPTTINAARIYDGQMRGEEGEENLLSFERLPYLAMSKTYNTNAQVPDSAGTMSAMVTGVKTQAGVLSVSKAAAYGDCASGLAAQVATLGELSELAGMATGIVTTARLTHATPAAVYAHSASRDWEADVDLSADAKAKGCKDIAAQLIDFPYGDGLEVAFGGGRANFLPAEMKDPQFPDRTGRRRDGRDLTAEWAAKSPRNAYVWRKGEFDTIDAASVARVLGLFDMSHMEYEADRKSDPSGEPSLAEMTDKAIDILSRNKTGFFLMVEAGRIDHAHHGGNAARALRDTQALSEAVAAALARTNEKDTLVVVTADHGHTLAIQGYTAKGNNILGLAVAISGGEGGGVDAEGHALADDGLPYTTLAYANGPGSVMKGDRKTNKRPAPSPDEVLAMDYRQQALIPMAYETHGGQDVTIYASGPRAYLLSGVVEQNYIFHVINDALALTSRASLEEGRP